MVWETKDLLVPRGSFPSNGNFEVQRDGVHLQKIITMALSGELLSNQGKSQLGSIQNESAGLSDQWLSKRGEISKSSACSLLPSGFYR